MNALALRSYRVVPGKFYGTPKEFWGFRVPRVAGTPVATAWRFLAANESLLGLAGVMLGKPKVIESMGAHHVIVQQRHLRQRVHRAYVTVHIGRDGAIYLAKNRVVPVDLLPPRPSTSISEDRARRRALASLPGSNRNVDVPQVERMWFPVGRRIRPAFRFRVHRKTKRTRSEWIVYVDRENGKILSKYDNLAQARGWARIFDPNPVIALGEGYRLLKGSRPIRHLPDEAYTTVRLDGLKGNGHLDGRRVSTRPMGRRRVHDADHRFVFENTQQGFEEAMVYFHIDRALQYLESLGYRGRRAIFDHVVQVDASGTRDDNSSYSPGRKQIVFGTGGVDDAEDAEVILHELGHAVQDAICPDFGQSPEAAAIGEGFGDYFAASFFASRKTGRFRPTFATWDAVASHQFDPPCLRRLDEPLTYESFDHSGAADEHVNGRIWSATLWEIWQAVGRDVADRIIVESHFQLDGFTTFARGARAIVDADQNLFDGRHRALLLGVFRSRGIGPVE